MVARIVVVLLFAATAFADPAADKAAGEAAFRVGAQAYRANHFGVAAEAFEQAYARDARPETAFSIAQANRLQYYLDRIPWRVQRAVQLYRAYLDKLPAGPRARDALDRLGELEPMLVQLRDRGELVPYVPPRRTQIVVGSDVDAAAVSIDDKPLALWDPTDVAAGSHEIQVTAAGYAPARRRVTITDGGFLPVDVSLRPLPGAITANAEGGAALVVDGRTIGDAATARAEVADGEHVVTVTRRGRVPWTRTVAVGRAETLRVDVALQPTAQRRVAWWVLGAAASTTVASGAIALWSYAARRDANALDAKRATMMATSDDLRRYNERVADARERAHVAGASRSAPFRSRRSARRCSGSITKNHPWIPLVCSWRHAAMVRWWSSAVRSDRGRAVASMVGACDHLSEQEA